MKMSLAGSLLVLLICGACSPEPNAEPSRYERYMQSSAELGGVSLVQWNAESFASAVCSSVASGNLYPGAELGDIANDLALVRGYCPELER